MKLIIVCKKILYVIVALGATYSFFFWLPSTQMLIATYGIRAAIASTHIPRLILDLLSIVVCIMAFCDASK